MFCVTMVTNSNILYFWQATFKKQCQTIITPVDTSHNQCCSFTLKLTTQQWTKLEKIGLLAASVVNSNSKICY